MMKNSEISTISISRNKEIQANVETAMIRLDEWNHLVGNLVMIKYYTEDGNIDAIFAVGVKEGIGRDCYSIISTAELYVVNDVLYEDPVSVESLVDYQRFLCKHDGEWKILKLGENKYRTYIDIPENLHIFRNLADGFQYFYDSETYGLKREDTFITTKEIEEILKEFGENIEPSSITELEIVGGKIYPKGSHINDLQFNLYIENFKNEDVTDLFEVKLYTGLDEVSIEKIDGNSYRIYEEITTTTTYTLKATRESLTLEESFTISVVSPTIFGKMYTFDPTQLPLLSQTLWDGVGDFEFITNLTNEITIMAIPADLTQTDFTSIKDTHGLNYINDYEITEYEVFDVDYKIYHKIDQVTINNFKQTFGYE